MPGNTLPNHLVHRGERLHGLHERLTKHHFGLSSEIEALLDAFKPWYLFAETQERPRSIGLWGMTGTGKSSLVRSLVKATGVEDRTFWLDAGESNEDYWLEKFITLMEEHLNGAPFILVVDEFQHARTKQEDGAKRSEPGMLRRFWEMLDTGRIVTWPNYWRVTVLKDFEARFRRAVDAGVRIESGRVLEESEVFTAHVATHYRSSTGTGWAIPPEIWDDLRDLHPAPLPSLTDFEKRLTGSDEQDILEWLTEIGGNIRKARVVDASKCLVILIGNLDELYMTGQEPLAELDPDVLQQRHRNIGTAGVQHALLKLFRIEQVARIGTTHVVFPPIGRDTIDHIVGQATDDLCQRLSAHCGATVVVDRPLIDHLRTTSTIAVLGARPVVEAVQNAIPGMLSQVLDRCGAGIPERIRLGVENGTPVGTCTTGRTTSTLRLKWNGPSSGSPARSHANIHRTAVHETGHLLCGRLLCGKRALQICVDTRSPHIGGFVAWETDPDRILTRGNIVPELATILGGWVAEFISFGDEGVSAGSEDDMQRATAFALGLAKNTGLGAERLHHAEHASAHEGFRTMLASAEAQAKHWIEEAERLALDTLRAHWIEAERITTLLVEEGTLVGAELETSMATGTSACQEMTSTLRA